MLVVFYRSMNFFIEKFKDRLWSLGKYLSFRNKLIIATIFFLYLLDFIVKDTRMVINTANYYLVGRPDMIDQYKTCENLDFLFRFTLTPIKDCLVSIGLIFLFRHQSGLDKKPA